jgi:hypothetical protein
MSKRGANMLLAAQAAAGSGSQLVGSMEKEAQHGPNSVQQQKSRPPTTGPAPTLDAEQHGPAGGEEVAAAGPTPDDVDKEKASRAQPPQAPPKPLKFTCGSCGTEVKLHGHATAPVHCCKHPSCKKPLHSSIMCKSVWMPIDGAYFCGAACINAYNKDGAAEIIVGEALRCVWREGGDENENEAQGHNEDAGLAGTRVASRASDDGAPV